MQVRRARSRCRRIVGLAVGLAVLSSCGGGGGGRPAGSAAGTDSADDVAHLQPGNRPVRFRLDAAVTTDQEGFIVETLGWAHTDLGDSGPLTVHVYSDEEHFVVAYTNDFGIDPAQARKQLAGGQTAFESPGGHIWIYLPNYSDSTEAERRHALFHEYVHTLQEWQAEVIFQSKAPAERSFVPRWMVEGCAEYLAVETGAARGFVDARRERAFVVDEVRRTAEPLASFETNGQPEFLGGSGDAYTVGWLGCERLVLEHGVDGVARQFWLAMAKSRDWNRAFADAFGLAPATFYADFERFRATL